jgi:hypothetical protein
MAKEIAKLLRTEMAADVTALPMLAKLLQGYGRKGDKMLAHITPEEAQRLEDEGGSGTINPHTGLPEYFDGDFMTDTSQEMGSFTPEAAAEQFPEYYPQGEVPQPGEVTTFAPSEGGVIPTYGAPQTQDFFASRGLPTGTVPTMAAAPSVPLDPALSPGMQYQTPEQITAAAPQEKGFFEGMSPQEKRNLALRAALGVGSGLMAGYAGRQAQKQAQKAKQEISDIGKPYQETGKRLQEQALRGELTPAGQQQVQAAQAQLAQGAERRGGVGAQQAATQIAALRQNLLDQQYNYGLKVAQIGDSYAAQAIRTGLTQDAGVSTSMRALGGALAGFYGSQPNA